MSLPSFMNINNEGSQKSLPNSDNQLTNRSKTQKDRKDGHSRRLSELPSKPINYNRPFLLNESFILFINML